MSKKIKRASLNKINYCDCGSEDLRISMVQSNLWQVRCVECFAVMCYLGCAEVEKIDIIKRMEFHRPTGLD